MISREVNFDLATSGDREMSQRKFPVTSSREDTLPESQWTMEFDSYEEVCTYRPSAVG